MKKVLALTLIVLFAFVSFATAVPASLKTSIIPADAQWVIQLDVQKFAASTFGKLMEHEAGLKKNEFSTTMKEKLGIDPMKDMEGVTIYGSGDEKNTVVYWSGNFNPKRIISHIKKEAKDTKITEERYGKTKYYNLHKDVCLSFPKDGLALVAMSKSAMTDAIDVLNGKKKSLVSSDLLNYLKEAPSSAFIRAAVDDLAGLAGKNHAPAMLKKAGGAFFMAAEQNENFKMLLKVKTDTPETAKNIHQLVQGFMALAKLQKEVPAHLEKAMKMLDNLKINVNGNFILAEFSHPSKELAELLMGLASHKKKHKHSHKH